MSAYIYYFNFANASLILENPFSIFCMLLAKEIRIQSLSPKAFPAYRRNISFVKKIHTHIRRILNTCFAIAFSKE
jgi:hypothetical protein